MNALTDWLLLPRVIQRFRRHPEAPDWWLFDEGWPWRGVWAIHGKTDMRGTEGFFGLRMGDWLSAGEAPWLMPFVWLWLTLERRRWLKRNAHRMPRALWRRARRLYPDAQAA